MKFLVSIVLLGLACQATARVIRILPAPECSASSILPIEGGNDNIAVLPIESEPGAAILPVKEESGAAVLPVEQPEYIWPVRPVPPVGFIPPPENSVLPVDSGAGSSILPVEEPEYIWPVRPVPPVGFIPPPENSILPVEGTGNEASILPINPNPISVLPIEDGGSSGGSNKLPPTFAILPVDSGNEASILPVNPISVLPIQPEPGCDESEHPHPPVAPQPEYEIHIPDHHIIF